MKWMLTIAICATITACADEPLPTCDLQSDDCDRSPHAAQAKGLVSEIVGNAPTISSVLVTTPAPTFDEAREAARGLTGREL